MTRINVIDPVDLTDQHLIAEHFELPRVYRQARLLDWWEFVPTYRMGKGHLKFFYSLMGYCKRRHGLLVAEMQRRGFKVQERQVPSFPISLSLDWTPKARDVEVNLRRLAERTQSQKHAPRYKGSPVSRDFYGVWS